MKIAFSASDTKANNMSKQSDGHKDESLMTNDLEADNNDQPLDKQHDGSTTPTIREAYDTLCCYTLTHTDPSFIHQLVVDAFAAQDANDTDKPMRLTFALVGLYLHVEKGFKGKQVQLVHMKLARNKQTWPQLRIPAERGAIDAVVVLSASLTERDQMIHNWCQSVWHAFCFNRDEIAKLLRENAILETPRAWPIPTRA